MSVIKSLVIAFSMYSKIPMPHLELEEKDMSSSVHTVKGFCIYFKAEFMGNSRNVHGSIW